MFSPRRTRTRGLVLSLIVLLMLSSGIFSKKVHADQQITIGTTEALVNLDPADAGDVFSWEILTHLYTGLTRQIPGSLRYELALAASHTISTDGLTHTFTIQPNAAFDDGTPITAQTFADSINRMLNLKGRGWATVGDDIQGAAVDANGALVITLKSPIPYLEQLLALPPFFPVNPQSFPADQLNRTPDHLITNGIYKVSAFNVSQSLTLIADPAWKGTPPATSMIVLRHFNLPRDLREALKAHQVDVAWRGLPPDDATNALQVKGIQAVTAPSLQAFYLLLDQTDQPFNDPVARQGLAEFINRAEVTHRGLRDTASPLFSLVPTQIDSSAPAFPDVSADQANATLKQGGYSKFKQITSELQTSHWLYGDLYGSAADTLSSQWLMQSAFRINRFDMETQAFLDQIDQGQFRLTLIGLTPLVPHPAAYLEPLLVGTLAIGAHYDKATIKNLLAQAAMTSDLQAQNALYDQIQTLAVQDVVAIPVWQGQQSILAWDDIGHITIEPNFLLHYDQLSLGGF